MLAEMCLCIISTVCSVLYKQDSNQISHQTSGLRIASSTCSFHLLRPMFTLMRFAEPSCGLTRKKTVTKCHMDGSSGMSSDFLTSTSGPAGGNPLNYQPLLFPFPRIQIRSATYPLFLDYHVAIYYLYCYLFSLQPI